MLLHCSLHLAASWYCSDQGSVLLRYILALMLPWLRKLTQGGLCYSPAPVPLCYSLGLRP